MRNAGDLGSAYDLCSDFKTAGLSASRALELPAASALFTLDDGSFEERYVELFDAVCREIAMARPAV